jgi:long-chain acyl-CoA synthetase
MTQEVADVGQLGALVQSLDRAASEYASRPAVAGRDVNLTFAQVSEVAEALARTLKQSGVKPNEPVLVRASNNAADFAAFFGVWRARGVVVPLHRLSPPDAVAQVQRKARARVEVDIEDVVASPEKWVRPATAASNNEVSPERPILEGAAFVIFTSGSTGVPKGVVLSHAAFRGKLGANQSVLRFSQLDRTLLVLNDTFSFGIWVGLLTLLSGGLLIIEKRFDANRFVETLVADEISCVGVVPTMGRLLFATLDDERLHEGKRALQKAGRLRRMLIGGETLGAELSRKLRDLIEPAPLYDIYGLTETSTSDFFLLPADYAVHPDSIGRAAPGVQFRIADDRGREIRSGEVGELLIRSPYLMSGYLHDPALTEAAFYDKWFRTGDLASVSPDGFVSLAGRIKEVIVRGGVKVTPGEIEQAAGAYPGVVSAVAVGVEDAVFGQRIHVLLVPSPRALIEINDVVDFVERRLDKFKWPDAYYASSELPTGRTGKLDRGTLREIILSGALKPVGIGRRGASGNPKG